MDVKDSVVVTTENVIVTVSFTPPINMDLHGSDYFIKQLKKKIPALDNVIIADNPISVIMRIPVNGKNRNNTIVTIANLGKMAIDIISLIIDNSSIPVRIEGFAKDCKPWFKNDEDESKSK